VLSALFPQADYSTSTIRHLFTNSQPVQTIKCSID
jgi:hypothetical protein